MQGTTAVRTRIGKTVRPGRIPDYNGRMMDVYCKIEFDGQRLSITGVEGPLRSGNAKGSCGQIDGHYAHRDPKHNDRRETSPTEPSAFEFATGWDAELWLDFLDVWKRWHLNDLSPMCEHQRALGWGDMASEEVTLYHYRTNKAVRDRVREAEKTATAHLRAGETVTLPPDVLALRALPDRVTTASPEPPSADYEPNGPQYDGDHYNRASEVKTRGWVRPSEHPDGLLTAPCPECGYAYGSEWKTETVPDDVLEFLRALPAADKTPAWV